MQTEDGVAEITEVYRYKSDIVYAVKYLDMVGSPVSSLYACFISDYSGHN